jgi:3-oxoacyl-[acyl-carrier-protein] synthase II
MSMDEIWITGLGLCSALGPSLEQSWATLLQRKSGICLHQPFPEQRVFPLGLVGHRLATVNGLLDGALEDLKQSGAMECLPLDESFGIVVGSSRGYQAELEQLRQNRLQESSLLDWNHYYSASPGRHIAQRLGGLACIHPSPRAACATGLWAIAQGMDLIQRGDCDRTLVGAVEAPVTPLTLAGFEKMGALAQSGAHPFDQNRDGFVLGEGAALLLLERRSSAERQGRKAYARVLGAGFSNDAYHLSTPHPYGEGAIAAIQQCLAWSHRSATAVDYIHAHGTATLYNDQMEANLIQSCFPTRTAISSTKGATGHTLGASGAIGVAICAMALHQQVLPPCVGLEKPEFAIHCVSQAERAPLNTVLCLSFGFGGQNGAMALAAV